MVDIDEERARSASEEYDVSHYTDSERAYTDPEIDAVVICVPHHLHMSLAIDAMEAGSHVLVEKVMTTSVEEGERMVETAAETIILSHTRFGAVEVEDSDGSASVTGGHGLILTRVSRRYPDRSRETVAGAVVSGPARDSA